MYSKAALWLTHVWSTLKALVRDDSEAGQGLVEYALILIFVAVVVVVILSILAPGIGNTYSNLVQTL